MDAVMNAALTQGHCFYMFSSHFKWSGNIKFMHAAEITQ